MYVVLTALQPFNPYLHRFEISLPCDTIYSWIFNMSDLALICHVVQNQTDLLTVDDPIAVFYADVPQPLASETAAHLLPHSEHALQSPSPPPGWVDSVYNGCRAYLRTAQDVAIPVYAQDLLLNGSGVE